MYFVSLNKLTIPPQEMVDSNRRHAHSLESLLSPQWQLREAPAAIIGSHLASLRYKRQLTIADAHNLTEVDELLIVQMENGNAGKAATFSDYIQYTHGLASSLGEIVEVLFVQQSLPLDEGKLLKQIDETAQQLQAEGSSTTPMRIAKQIGLPLQRLREYPRVNSLLVIWEDQYRRKVAELNHQREEELVKQVSHAINRLEVLGEPITQERIAQLLGMSRQGLRIYPRVEALLMKVNTNFPFTKQRSHLDGSLERREAILSI